MPESKLTETARIQLHTFIEKQIANNESMFVEFFNKAEPVNTRLHQIELIPGFGKKHTEALLKERSKKPFESLEDLKKRVSNLPDIKKSVIKRIIEELSGKERYNLFIKLNSKL